MLFENNQLSLVKLPPISHLRTLSEFNRLKALCLFYFLF